MSFHRFLPSCGILLVVLLISIGCVTGPSEEELALQALQQQLGAINEAYSALQGKRDELATLKTTVDEIEAVAAGKRTDEQTQQLEQATTTITELQTTIDDGYEALQEQLAGFLNLALNNHPQAAETAEALKIYAMEAAVNADETVAKSGDYSKAIDTLSTAKGYYEAVSLAPVQPLLDKLAELDEWRYLNQERFDQVTNGMTEDEVREIAGVVYYQNIRENPNGTITWLYQRRDGGVAAITFNKKSKVYHKDFDAVKPRVVEE